MRLLIVIPTYNEIDNIEPLPWAIFANIPPDTEVLVVDDNSPDGTARVVEKITVEHSGRLHLLTREAKQGVATAFLRGFSWGTERGFDTLLAMYADFSHNPNYIPRMIEKVANYDMVIGSRNVKGGIIENRTWVRNLITKCAALYLDCFLIASVQNYIFNHLWSFKTNTANEPPSIKKMDNFSMRLFFGALCKYSNAYTLSCALLYCHINLLCKPAGF